MLFLKIAGRETDDHSVELGDTMVSHPLRKRAVSALGRRGTSGLAAWQAASGGAGDQLGFDQVSE